MRTVITGAASFIGAAAARECILAGDEVFCIIRPGSVHAGHLLSVTKDLPGKRPEIIEKDLLDIEELRLQADVMLHAGWDGAGSENRTKKEIQENNVALSMNALRAARSFGCRRFLFTGSQAEYGQRHRKMSEEDPAAPVSEYARAKVRFGLEARRFCEEQNMEYVHTRIYSVYGPGDHPWSLVSTCVDTFLQGGEMLLGDCTQLWNFLYIGDAARALCTLLREGKPGIYNVAGQDTRPLREYIFELYRLLGEKGSCRFGVRAQNAEGAADLFPDTEKIRTATSWRPEISFQEGIGRLLGEKK